MRMHCFLARMIEALLCLLLVGLLLSSAAAADWPQFRGPDSTAVAPDAELPAEPKIDWSVPLPGRGLASPIIVGDRVYVSCSSGPKQERLHLICLSAADGSTIWERQLRATGRTMSHPKTSIASSSPCSAGGRVFALWSSNDVAAFDLEGDLLWVRGLTDDYPNASNSLGMASSPLVIGETLVVMIENDSESYSLGLDVKTGRNLWKLERPKAANWTSPYPLRGADGSNPLVLLQSSKGLQAVDPVSGSRVWAYTEGASTSSSGVVSGGTVYVPSSGITALAPPPSGGTPEQLWRSKQTNPATISPLVLGGRLYSINNAGILAVIDLKAGENQWKLRLAGPFSASPVAAGTRLLAVNEKGLVQIVNTAAPQGALLGQLQLPLKSENKEMVLSTPSISGKHVFVRSDSLLWRLGN